MMIGKVIIGGEAQMLIIAVSKESIKTKLIDTDASLVIREDQHDIKGVTIVITSAEEEGDPKERELEVVQRLQRQGILPNAEVIPMSSSGGVPPIPGPTGGTA